MRLAQSRLRLRLLVLASLAILALLLPSLASAAPAEAAVESAPTWYGCSTYHTVRYGQTLSGIAKYYGVSQQAIMQANDIWNPSKIYAGQKLCIPDGGYNPPDPGDGYGCSAWHYVTYGQTLSQIARYYGVSMYAIMQANNLYNANQIYVGQKLCIPGGYVPEPPAPKPPVGCYSWYTVKYGDTLYKIASWYGTTVYVLMQYNGLSNPNHIGVGQVLKVPSDCGNPYPPDPCPCPPPPPPPPPPNPCPCPPPYEPPPPPSSGPWYGEYFNNGTLSGGPSFTNNVNNVSFNWGWGGPGNGLSPDNFSARWTRQEWLAGGTWRFYATSDDGVRVFVDDILVINSWKIQAAANTYGEIAVGDGYHTIRVEYFEGGGEALIYLNYQRVY